MSKLDSYARSAYDLAFQVSPIILTGGIVANTVGGKMPVIGLLGQLVGVAQDFLTSGVGLSSIGVRFVPVPGAQVINNSVGTYPFANQSIAANALVNQPLTISMQMIAPVNTDSGYLTKLAIFTALQQSFAAHNTAGGLYDIATPSFIYQNCMMVAMTDVTSGTTKQQQIVWQIDFVQPLVSLSAASGAWNGLMAKMANGQPSTGAWSGLPGVQNQGAISQVPGLVGNITQYLSVPL